MTRYSGCMVNGYRFHIQSREKDRRTQNSGIVVKGDHGNNEIDFYGILQDIIEVEYVVGKRKVILFKCDWVKNDGPLGIKEDKESGFISINMARKWYKDQPFILTQNARQVFYLADVKLGGTWNVVQNFTPRNVYDVPGMVETEYGEEAYQEDEPDCHIVIDLGDVSSLARGDLPLQVVTSNSSRGSASRRQRDTTSEADEAFNEVNNDVDCGESGGESGDEDLCTSDSSQSE